MRTSGLCLFVVVPFFAITMLSSCEGDDRRNIGEFCVEESDCESGLCYDSQCLNPDDDYDSDGLKNGVEKNITGTEYGLADTDADGIDDGLEVGDDPMNPPDGDGDGIIDAIESLAVSADPDRDCIPDQFDPENDVYTQDMAKVVEIHCTKTGVCGEDVSAVTALCSEGVPSCDYTSVAGYESLEASCDSKDNDCDGKTDEDLSPPDASDCMDKGVCTGNESVIFKVCRRGGWDCEYSAIDDWEKIEVSCDGKDNNCDGETDEGLLNQECFLKNEFGKCAGVTVCTPYFGVACDGREPAAEMCNGVDDNCNGETDEGLLDVPCTRENEFGACDGVTACEAGTGATTCTAAAPAPEACDNIDNDCDGETDDDNICGRTSLVKIRVVGSVLPVSMFTAAAATGSTTPLQGADVKFFAGTCPTSGTTGIEPVWTGTTGKDGVLLLAIEPGEWCVAASADGFQTMWSTMFAAPQGIAVPLEAVLLLNGMTNTQVSVCGRIIRTPDYATATDGSTEPTTEDPVPVPSALVTMSAALDNAEMASTISDANGFWCIAGLYALPADGAVNVSVIRDGFYPARRSMKLAINTLFFETVMMSPLPTNVTTCLFESFESDGFQGGWETTGLTDYPVQWIAMKSGVCIAQAYARECSMPFANESDSTAATTLLCKNPEIPAAGCIQAPGSLPSAVSGNGFAWFGNPETCSYAPFVETCSDMTTRTTGSLLSPWIDASAATSLNLSFISAWEVESSSPSTDIMYVEAQTSEMSNNDSWAVVALVREMNPTGRAGTAGTYTSGGVDSAPVWQQYSAPLDAFTGQWMRIRFRFDSVDPNNNLLRGWLVDDVAVSGVGCPAVPAS